ncbi:MAG: hypothetical protein ABFC42_13320 [Sulfuricella sp.]
MFRFVEPNGGAILPELAEWVKTIVQFCHGTRMAQLVPIQNHGAS